MTIPSIDAGLVPTDLDAAGVPLAATEDVNLAAGAAFQDAVARFRAAMGEGGPEDLSGFDPLTLKPFGSDSATPETLKAVVAENQAIAKTLTQKPLSVERLNVEKPKNSDSPADPSTSQPLGPTTLVAVQQVVSDVKVAAADAVSARTQVLVDAVEAVCDAILVSPGLVRGQGEIRIQLKPEVLSGTEISIEAKGTTLTVAFNPTTPDVAAILQQNITQFEQHLAGRIRSYQIAARVKGPRG